MVGELKVDDTELLAAIDLLKNVSPEQQEATILQLEEEHPGIGNRARALLAIEKQAAEAIAKLEKASTAKRLVAATPKPVLKPTPQPKPAPAPEKKAAILGRSTVTRWPKEWPEPPAPPANAIAYERLLYPPGLLGHAVQYIVDTAPLPDRRLALAVSLSTCAKGIDRKVLGPTDNSTVLFNQVIAETGAGKHHGISCSRSLLRAMGLERSIVASGLASVQAIEEIIEGIADRIDPNPNALVVVDEVGSWLSRILSRGQSGNVSEIPGILQTLWGQPMEDGWIGTKKVGKEMRTFFAVAFSIIGFSTERMFFGALQDRLVSSGFVNRMLLWNVGRGALERVDPKYGWNHCPEWLVEAMQKVTSLPFAPLDKPMKLTLPTKDGSLVVLKDFHRLNWGPGAKEQWLKFDNKVRAMPSVEDREVWIRAPDLAVRLATIVAFYRCSPTVDVADWEWAVEVVKHSTEQLRIGLDKHMINKLEQADLAEKIRDYIRARRGQLVKIGDVKRTFERKVDDMRKLENVIWHVVEAGDVAVVPPEEVQEALGVRAGRPTTWFTWSGR